jgi:hypothetical protein
MEQGGMLKMDSQATESGGTQRVFKPGPHNYRVYLWTIPLIFLGVLSLFQGANPDRGALLRILCFLMGGFGVCVGVCYLISARQALSTHFVISEQGVMLVMSKGITGLRWEEVRSVVIYERPDLMMPGHMDRMVVLLDTEVPLSDFGLKTILQDEHCRLVLNTSVLSPQEEDEFLAQIRAHVTCPIHVISQK